jgi:hypothetical protein
MAGSCPIGQSCPVKTFKLICLTIKQLIKEVRLLPQTFMNIVRQRQEQTVRNKLEVERLDRIRNPFKYRGK